METIESRIQKVQKQAQTGGDKAAKQTYEVLVRYKEALEQGKSARTVQFESKDEQKIAKELFLLTSKPVMYVEKMVAKWATIRYTDDHILDYMEVDASHAIFEVEVPKEWIGKTVGKLDIRKKYDINIMAVKDDGKVSMAISADTCFKEDVTLLVLGEYKAIKKCFCI